MPAKIHHPHDSLFRVAMSNLKVAKDFLKTYLPLTLVKCIDWHTLQITNKSYVEETFKDLLSDMVYKCTINKKAAYIYLLIEQQTKPYRLLPFKILEYDVIICREHIKQGNKELPLVANLVLYSGKKTPYPYSLDIYDCFQTPDMAREMMFKPLELVDLGQASEAELATHGEADMLERLLKQSRERTFLNWIDNNPALVDTLAKRAYWKSGLLYMLDREQQHKGEALVKKLKFINPSKEEEIMQVVKTIRQESELIGLKKGRQEGKAEGMQQGMQQGMHNKALGIARNLLLKNMDVSFITETTGLDKKTITKLKKDKEAEPNS